VDARRRTAVLTVVLLSCALLAFYRSVGTEDEARSAWRCGSTTGTLSDPYTAMTSIHMDPQATNQIGRDITLAAQSCHDSAIRNAWTLGTVAAAFCAWESIGVARARRQREAQRAAQAGRSPLAASDQ
jgi:hypothetical protein